MMYLSESFMMYFIVFLIFFIGLLVLLFPSTTKLLLKNALRFLWGGHNQVTVRYHKDSAFCKSILQKCPILKERYVPPVWGYIGHLQTIWFGIRDTIIPPLDLKGTRHSVYVDDGSTITYDVFEPSSKTQDEVILVVPGISNSSESDYVRSFAKQANDLGYCVAVLNHIGSRRTEKLTGHRIFSYGGTGDLSLMFDDLQSKLSRDTVFICVGFSMGGLILIRFLAEQSKHHNRFLCGISVCQGYCSESAHQMKLSPWKELRKFYYYGMTKRLLRILNKHKEQIITSHPVIKRKLLMHSSSRSNSTTFSNGATHQQNGLRKTVSVPCLSRERDSNGFPVDPDRILVPDERMWKAGSFAELDEYYTRRIMGFDSYEEFRKWMSCADHFYQIPNIPMLMVNAFDDPVIPGQLSQIPIKYTEFNHKAMFVGTDFGGHVAFFEGGWIIPNQTLWSERLIFQYINGCRSS